MKKNMGSADRIIRLVLAAVAVILFYNGTLTGTMGIVALVVAAIFAVTSFVGFCPLYRLVGFSTCPVSPNQK